MASPAAILTTSPAAILSASLAANPAASPAAILSASLAAILSLSLAAVHIYVVLIEMADFGGGWSQERSYVHAAIRPIGTCISYQELVCRSAAVFMHLRSAYMWC